MGDTAFTCVGSLNAGGMQFHCINNTAHGELDLTGALEKSCNCYFISAARALGAQKVLSMAYNLGFGQAQEFGRGLWAASGDLPALQDLSNVRALANFSFGQGELTATPLQLCAMMNAIANGGTYASPKLVLGGPGDEGLYRPGFARGPALRRARGNRKPRRPRERHGGHQDRHGPNRRL